MTRPAHTDAHTEGPWEVKAAFYGDGFNIMTPRIAGRTFRLFVSDHATEQDALIAGAAPEYAEAAELMIAAEQSGGDLWWKGFEMLKAAHAKGGFDFPSKDDVIAKARGQS